MTILRESDLRDIAREKSGSRGLVGMVDEVRSYSKSTSLTSIFLSHSHRDKDKVEQAKIFFENLGITIYVDWMDETMPDNPNGATALKIRKKINENQKFILIATNRAVNSKWCNWETGIGDIYKYNNDNIAILGLADNQGDWSGNEYLKIYPSIEYENGYSTNTEGRYISSGYYVLYPSDEKGNNRYKRLDLWLRE